MSLYDFSAQRLFVDIPLRSGATVSCSRDQSNYLLNVLRLKPGNEILLFNGVEGEWRAQLEQSGKRDCRLSVIVQTRRQSGGPDLHYLFAPLKKARLDYMVQKATELGVSRLQPVMTRRTQSSRVKLDRLRSNVIEAAEQCGILRVPEVIDVIKLEHVLENWEEGRSLIFCDENSAIASPLDALANLKPGPLAVLIGPEGGFDEEEQKLLKRQSYVTAISLGPRIMRADTAAVAALSLVNAVLGDWRDASGPLTVETTGSEA